MSLSTRIAHMTFECPACLIGYNFGTDSQANSMPCGHTMCRICLEILVKKGGTFAKCPICQAPYGSSVPNFLVHEIMLYQKCAAAKGTLKVGSQYVKWSCSTTQRRQLAFTLFSPKVFCFITLVPKNVYISIQILYHFIKDP